MWAPSLLQGGWPTTTRDEVLMIHRRCAGILLGILILFSPFVRAQVNVSSVTIRSGVIRTMWHDHGSVSVPLWAFYPEIQIGGMLFLPYLRWGASWGYWSDGIDRPLPVMDMVTYSQSSHVVAMRMEFHPRELDQHVPIPISVFVGAAEHFVRQEYIGGADLAGNGGQNSSDRALVGFAGVGVSFRVLPSLSLEGEVRQFIPFGESEDQRAHKDRRVFSIGGTLNF